MWVEVDVEIFVFMFIVRDMFDDKLRGFVVGVDDYLVKLFVL